MSRRSTSPVPVFGFILCALALIWSCRAADLAGDWERQNVATAIAQVNAQAKLTPTEVAPNQNPPDEVSPDETSPDETSPDESSPDESSPDETSPDESPTDEYAPDEVPTDEYAPDEDVPEEDLTEEPADTPEVSTTLTPSPTLTPTRVLTPTQMLIPTPVLSPTPRATPTSTRPSATALPTRTFTPAFTPTPTRCAYKYCVTLADCKPGNNTRAIGTVYENGVPKSGVRVRVSYSDGGPPVVSDFISGNNPTSPNFPDPNHPGYYQIGIREGSAFEGNWWVFLIDDKQRQISDGHFFKTSGIVTGNSCQVGITDFSK